MTAPITIHIDGAARGNPGPAAFAYVITGDAQPSIEASGCLGQTTNNVAEYTALVRALERARQLGARRLRIRSDSELLVKQMNGLYRVKNPDLQVLYEQAKDLSDHFEAVELMHVRREQNKDADRLCNEALDGGPRKPAKASPRSKPSTKAASDARTEAARADALDCLRSAAVAWAEGRPNAPRVEDVWDQLWSILEEQGVLRSGRK
jgi:ribonuclease HI